MLRVTYRTHLFIGKPDTEENRAAFVSTIPMGRGSTPADIANACCYLASDEAEFITGVNLEVRKVSFENRLLVKLTLRVTGRRRPLRLISPVLGNETSYQESCYRVLFIIRKFFAKDRRSTLYTTLNLCVT